MGSIKNVLDGNKNVHLLLSKSNLAEIYVYDALKGKCGASKDSIFTVDSARGISELLELVNIPPFLANKWLFVIEYRKAKALFKDYCQVFQSDTSEFLIKVNSYKEFLEVRGYLSNINDIYLSRIGLYDVEFLLNEFNIPYSLVKFIYKSYSLDPEQVFIIREELKNGRVFEKRKEIVDLCGVSQGSLSTYAFSLLKDFPTTDKGRKTVYRNRLKVGVELMESYGCSKFKNFLTSTVKDILDIKQLYVMGVLYDNIRDIPEYTVRNSKGDSIVVFDKQRLSRYNMYLKTIADIPSSRIINLYLQLKESGTWRNDIDMLNFLYNYYEKGE